LLYDEFDPKELDMQRDPSMYAEPSLQRQGSPLLGWYMAATDGMGKAQTEEQMFEELLAIYQETGKEVPDMLMQMAPQTPEPSMQQGLMDTIAPEMAGGMPPEAAMPQEMQVDPTRQAMTEASMAEGAGGVQAILDEIMGMGGPPTAGGGGPVAGPSGNPFEGPEGVPDEVLNQAMMAFKELFGDDVATDSDTQIVEMIANRMMGHR
jgi:hypothetical protein